MALYPQLTAQGSAHQGLRERSLLRPPDPCVSKAAPEPQPQTGPDLGRRVASDRTWLESYAQRMGVGVGWWPGPLNSLLVMTQ